jgi:hypothetical protein
MIGLAIRHVITHDLDDGRPLPPTGDFWSVVTRVNGRTTWRKLSLSLADAMSPAPRDFDGDIEETSK